MSEKCCCAGAGEKFKELQPVLDKYAKVPGSLITILQKTQEIYGYLSMEAINHISEATGIKPAKIYGVATFYAQFRLQPVGKYLIMLCQGTACHVNGSEMIEEAVCEHLGIKDGETILRSPAQELSETERDALHDDVLAIAREFGFQLQQWADRWYLTRNKDWQVLVRPWCAQEFQPFTEASLQGPEAESFKSLDQKLRAILKKSAVNQKRLSEGLETIDGFWPDGGSRRHLLKPSTLRAVMANDSFVWGWAQNAGLLNFRTTAVKNDWPEAPEGDLLAVIDDLYVPYREKNWSLWAQKLPDAIASISHLWNLAHARRCGRLVLIASGAKDTHTVVIEKGAAKGLFSRFKKKKALNVESFLGEVSQ